GTNGAVVVGVVAHQHRIMVVPQRIGSGNAGLFTIEFTVIYAAVDAFNAVAATGGVQCHHAVIGAGQKAAGRAEKFTATTDKTEARYAVRRRGGLAGDGRA